MASFQLRGDFVASATTALTILAARSAVIEFPYGTSNGIWAGTAAGAVGVARGCRGSAPPQIVAAAHAARIAKVFRRMSSSQGYLIMGVLIMLWAGPSPYATR